MTNIRGYPKHVNTKKDFKNLLGIKEHKERAKADLTRIHEIKDEKVTVAVKPIDPENPEGEWETKEISNPSRIFRRYGFTTKKEIKTSIEANKEEVRSK